MDTMAIALLIPPLVGILLVAAGQDITDPEIAAELEKEREENANL